MKCLLHSILSALVLMTPVAAFASSGSGATGSGWVPARPSDVDWISHNTTSVWNNDTVSSRDVSASLGAVTIVSAQAYSTAFYVNNNGLTQTCYVTWRDLSTGIEYGNFAINTGSGPQTFYIAVSVPTGTFSIGAYCSLPRKNGSTASIIYMAR